MRTEDVHFKKSGSEIDYTPLDSRYECNICHKLLKSESILNTHISSVHNQKGSEKCDTCGKVLANLQSKITHQRRFHSDVGEYR